VKREGYGDAKNGMKFHSFFLGEHIKEGGYGLQVSGLRLQGERREKGYSPFAFRREKATKTTEEARRT
jgi:hypothetical protein